MENEFVAKFFQDIDDDVLLQLFLVTSSCYQFNMLTQVRPSALV